MQHEDGRTRFEHYYLTTLAGHVVANEIFVASSNLAGLDNTTRFPGASMILGPGVRRQARLEEPYYRIYAGDIADCREEIIAATLELSLAERIIYRDNPFTGLPPGVSMAKCARTRPALLSMDSEAGERHFAVRAFRPDGELELIPR